MQRCLTLDGYKLISQFVSITFAPLSREACINIMRCMFLFIIIAIFFFFFFFFFAVQNV